MEFTSQFRCQRAGRFQNGVIFHVFNERMSYDAFWIVKTHGRISGGLEGLTGELSMESVQITLERALFQ